MRDAGIYTADGPHDPRINAGDGRGPGINNADGDVESGANTRIDGKSPEVVPKKTRARAQSNNSGKSPKRGKPNPQSGTAGAAEITSDRNNSLSDHETNGELITAGQNDNDAIKGCGDHGRGRS